MPNPRPPSHYMTWDPAVVANITSDAMMNRSWLISGPLVRRLAIRRPMRSAHSHHRRVSSLLTS